MKVDFLQKTIDLKLITRATTRKRILKATQKQRIQTLSAIL